MPREFITKRMIWSMEKTIGLHLMENMPYGIIPAITSLTPTKNGSLEIQRHLEEAWLSFSLTQMDHANHPAEEIFDTLTLIKMLSLMRPSIQFQSNVSK